MSNEKIAKMVESLRQDDVVSAQDAFKEIVSEGINTIVESIRVDTLKEYGFVLSEECGRNDKDKLVEGDDKDEKKEGSEPEVEDKD